MSKAKEKAREYVSQKLKENGYRNFHGTECVECAYISGYTQSVTDLSTENSQLREALREILDTQFNSDMSHFNAMQRAKRLITYKEDK